MAGGGNEEPVSVAAEAVNNAGQGGNGEDASLNRPEDGPMLMVINKRLRALKKKANRIVQIEENIAGGKAINKEQEDVLRSKTNVLLLIDEFEKLRSPLQVALKEELAAAESSFLNQALQQRAAAAAAAEAEAQAQAQAKNGEANGEADEQTSTMESAVEDTFGSKAVEDSAEHVNGALNEEELRKLVELLYFGALFDGRVLDGQTSITNSPELMQWKREQERNACLSHDAPMDGDATLPLAEEHLNAIAAFSRLLITRNLAATNHKEAVEYCLQHITKWMAGVEEEIDESLPLTYAFVKERLGRILSSEYFTRQTLDVNPEVAAAAAAAGQYVSEPLPDAQPGEDLTQGFPGAQQAAHYIPQDPSGAPQYYAPPQYAEYAVPGQERGLPEGAGQHMLVPPITTFVPQGGFTVVDATQVHPQYAGPDISQVDQSQQQQQQAVDQAYLSNGIQYSEQQVMEAYQQQQQQQPGQQQPQLPQVNLPQMPQQGVPGGPGVSPGAYAGASRGPMGGRLQGGASRGYGRGRGGRGGNRGGRGPNYDMPGGTYGQGGYRGGRSQGRGGHRGRAGAQPQWANAQPVPNGQAQAPIADGPQ